MNNISPEEFNLIAKYIYDVSGILLNTSKTYLVETRLGAVLEEFGCSSYKELHQKALSGPGTAVKERIIDAISTNETLFFRDTGPFELLKHKILPELIDMRTAKGSSIVKPTLRIWSAACSTGQEIYSIAMVLKELLPDITQYNIKLLGTDISDAAIQQASYGKFNKFEIERGLSQNMLLKYFTPNGTSWKIKDEIRAMVNFRKLNLMVPFSSLGKFDVIFCRNVAIYFPPTDRKKLFDRLADSLDAGGALIIGSTESLTGISDRFEPLRHLRSIFYRVKQNETEKPRMAWSA